MKYKCPCCGYFTYNEQPSGTYDICPVCFWVDDPIQLIDEYYAGGANKVNLIQARKNYKEFGACEESMKGYVRPLCEDEKEVQLMN